MATSLDIRPEPGDLEGWRGYHQAAAARIAAEPPGKTEADRMGQLLGELDHLSEADGYRMEAKVRAKPEPREEEVAPEISEAEILAAVDEGYRMAPQHLRQSGPIAVKVEEINALAIRDKATFEVWIDLTQNVKSVNERYPSLSYEDVELALREGAVNGIESEVEKQKAALILRQERGLAFGAEASSAIQKFEEAERSRSANRALQPVVDEAKENQNAGTNLPVLAVETAEVVEPTLTLKTAFAIEREEILYGYRAEVAAGIADPAAVANHFSGRATEFNNMRDLVARTHHVELGPAIDTEEFVVANHVQRKPLEASLEMSIV